MPKEVEKKLLQQAAARRLKGKAKQSYVYGTMNKMGLMHGNKASYKNTSKSRALKMVRKMGKDSTGTMDGDKD